MGDSDFDEYDGDGFDEAFADLIESLNEGEASTSTTFDNVNATPPEYSGTQSVQLEEVDENGDDHKVPQSTISELNERIQNTALSPFERFRRNRGTLSVTDLVSLDWCEMQFLYTLEGGKKRRTEAMKQGNIIHQALEKELHETIAFKQITTPEETWALRFLNILFGLQELQRQGMTREFRVVGIIEGHLVTGIIDQIAKEPEIPLDSRPMDAFVGITPKKKLVISDVKTRVGTSLPKIRNSRPNEMQLSLYHQLFSDMVDGKVDMERVFVDLELNPENAFSDGYLAEAAETYSATGVLSFEALLENNTLNKLWSVLKVELAQLQGLLSHKMEIEYRHQKTNQIIGTKTFEYNQNAANDYIHRVLEWWDGQRSTQGVEIEEAYKCRLCDFEEGCSWRAAKVEKLALQRSRLQSPPPTLLYGSESQISE